MDDLRARLLNQPLYLRGLWGEDKLKFSALGQLTGDATPTSFTLSGMEVLSLRIEPGKLVLKARRVGLKFQDDKPQRVALRSKSGFLASHDVPVTIEIASPADGNFNVPLDRIVTTQLVDLVRLMPFYWQRYAFGHFILGKAVSEPPPDMPDSLYTIPPRLLKQKEPAFSQAAKMLAYSGHSLVSCNVNADGTPSNLTTVHPVGLGLDENAIEAVQSYVFSPEMKDGHPTSVEVNIDVNFRVY